MLTNFHTHHEFCRHAKGRVIDYVKKAIEEGYDCIGISDHAPMPKYYNDRMTLDELNIYLQEIKKCQEMYKDQIKIYSGLEIEYFEDQDTYYKELITKVDYLIYGNHDYKYKDKQYCAFFIENDEGLKGYFDNLIKGIESHYFTFAAHPDLFLINYHFNDLAKAYTHQLAQVCAKNDFILEFNANGFRRGESKIHNEVRYPYPYKPFWDIIKEYEIRVIVNSDCHEPELLNDAYDQFARIKAKEFGLEVVDTIFK